MQLIPGAEPSGPAWILLFNFLEHWSLFPSLHVTIFSPVVASLYSELKLTAQCLRGIYFPFSCWHVPLEEKRVPVNSTSDEALLRSALETWTLGDTDCL